MEFFSGGAMNPILLHANYFEQGQSVERACQLAREMGADGIEFRRQPPKHTGTDLQYLDVVSRALDKYPLAWVSIGGPGVDLMGDDGEMRAKEIERAENFFRKAASRFRLNVVNTFAGSLRHADSSLPYLEYWHHGSAIATCEQWSNAVEGFQHLGAVAGELGFRLAFETHGVYLHDTLKASLDLVRKVNSPHVGLLWDQANLLIFPEHPSFDEVIDTVGPDLFAVHVKNLLVPPQQFLAVSALSQGILNIRDQVARLLKAGYDGPFCLEAPRDGDREHFAREDFTYFRSVLTNA